MSRPKGEIRCYRYRYRGFAAIFAIGAFVAKVTTQYVLCFSARISIGFESHHVVV